MKKYITLITSFILLLAFNVFAQNKDDLMDRRPRHNKTKSLQTSTIPNSPQTIGDSVSIKNNSGTVLINIIDEGSAGSIKLNMVGIDESDIVNTTNKLYNLNTILYWNGAAISSGSGATTYAVGDFAQGGVVFWVDETAEHGLVCAKEDLNGGNTEKWYYDIRTYTMARGDGPFSGEMNTTIIIANQGGSIFIEYAGLLCSVLEVIEGGKTYGDWYLPSKQELNLMYLNRTTINTIASVNGGSNFNSTSSYWSSTEDNISNAWAQEFSTGFQVTRDKGLTFFIRAVRAF